MHDSDQACSCNAIKLLYLVYYLYKRTQTIAEATGAPPSEPLDFRVHHHCECTMHALAVGPAVDLAAMPYYTAAEHSPNMHPTILAPPHLDYF